MNDETALAVLESRIKALLPDEYQDCYEEVQPVSMGSAGLKFDGEGRVAWNEMWGSFCDLAMAGGPPHKGTLLEPGTQPEIDRFPDRYATVVEEISRGVNMVTDLFVRLSPVPGWVRIACHSEGMAQWLLRAIVVENVAVRAEGTSLDLPAAPHFRLEKEIKNVVTVSAKTCHYWLGHISRHQQRTIAALFGTMAAESPLVEPARPAEGDLDTVRALTLRMADRIHRDTGLPPSSRRSAGWLGVECPSVKTAIWLMRALVASNVLARREETTLFVPANPAHDPSGDRVVRAVTRAHRLAAIRGVLQTS